MSKSEHAMHDTQQRHLHDAWNKNLTPACGLVDCKHIGRDTERSDLHRLGSRPHRIVHEIPRHHTINGYVFDS
jgi:hypothetical protein